MMLVLELSVTLSEVNAVSFVMFLSASAQNIANRLAETKPSSTNLKMKGFVSSLMCSS